MKPIYLEPDEEITSIIERIAQTKDTQLAIVVPKNSTMFQSLVNLKLLARQAKKLGKAVAIISTNKVGSRLAKQVGLETYANVGTIGQATSMSAPAAGPAAAEPAIPDVLPDGTPIHRYSPDGVVLPTTDSTAAAQSVEAKSAAEAAEDKSLEPVDSPPPAALEPVAISKPSAETAVAPTVDTPLSHPEDQPKSPPASPPATEPLPSFVSRGVKTTREFNFVFPWKSALVALGMVLIAAVITFLFLPKATITMTFPAELLSAEFDLAVKTTAVGDGSIAGNLLTVDKTDTAPVTATGKKDVGTKAGGTITLYNKASSSPVTLAAGTTLTTASKNFTLDKQTTIPGATVSSGSVVPGQTSAAITATTAGDGYNVSNAQFSINGQSSSVYGSGTTTGGTTKQVTVLSQEDVDKAYTNLNTQLAQSATTDLEAKAGNQTILDPAIKQTVQEQKVDKAVGTQTDSATVSMTLQLYTLAFDQSAIDEAAKTQLTSQLKPNQQLAVPDDKRAAPTFKDINGDRTVMNLHIVAGGFAAPLIDKVAVTKSVRNKSAASAVTDLKAKYQAEEVKVEIIPGWWIKRLPILAQAISVEYGFNAVPGT